MYNLKTYISAWKRQHLHKGLFCTTQGSPMKKFFILLSCLIFFQLSAYKYDLAATAIFQNEAPFLKEWIEFHRMLGVQKFYLYNNCSQDDYMAILKPYIKAGIVELEEAYIQADFNGTQVDCYNRTLIKTREKVKWLAVIDIDEYITFVDGPQSLVKALKKYEKFGGLALNWKCYGTSYVTLSRNDLMIENLIYRMPSSHGWNFHVKSIVRPSCVQQFLGPHAPLYLKKYYGVDVDGKRSDGAFSKVIKNDRFYITHFWTKDESFWENVKKPRRMKWGASIEELEALYDVLNEEIDETLLGYILELNARMSLVR